jgi:pimeloyl-ACP methyl ester carboxylesterase
VSPPAAPEAFEVVRDGVTLRGEVAGEGPAVLLLHGLTATRRYVVHGSRLLERAGHRVIQFDARGHGESSPAPDRHAYDYELLTADAVASGPPWWGSRWGPRRRSAWPSRTPAA